jgi:hypothetical protein
MCIQCANKIDIVALGQSCGSWPIGIYRGVLYGCNWQRQPARNFTESSLGECGQVASSCVVVMLAVRAC